MEFRRNERHILQTYAIDANLLQNVHRGAIRNRLVHETVMKFLGDYLDKMHYESAAKKAVKLLSYKDSKITNLRNKSKLNNQYNYNIANSNGNFHIGNYFNSSYGIFKGCKAPNRNLDFVSPSGSKYWYGSDKKGAFVIRKSNHWSKLGNKKYKHVQIKANISSCYWVLNLADNTPIKHEYAGKCYFADFKRNANTPS